MQSESMRVIGWGSEQCAPDKERVRLIPHVNMVHFILSGHGTFNDLSLSGGQGFVCRRDAPCCYHPAADAPWRYLWINLVGAEADRLLSMICDGSNVFRWHTGRNMNLLREICSSPWLQHTDSDELRAVGAFYLAASEIISLNVAPSPRNHARQARLYLQENYERGVTVQQTADALNLSRAYLRNIFHASYGCSPQAYLMRLRMERAEQLLQLGYRVGEVALAVGYADALQFSRIFSRYHGLPPSEFRKPPDSLG